jgi:cytochrome c peroxidase
MDFGIIPVLSIGGVAVLGGLGYLFLLVGRDLAPVSGLIGPQRWLLVGALGVGVFAFSVKLVAIALIAHFRPAHPDLARPAFVSTVSSVPIEDAPRPPPLWRALPVVAAAPAHNPTTPERVALGQRLFLETQLSRDGTLSCASCHDLARGGADTGALSRGVGGAFGARNAPSVYNAAFQKRLFWDGRVRSLEEQAKGPLLNPVEMAMPDALGIEQRLRMLPDYAPLFMSAFGDEAITLERVAQAIAAFERTLITPDTPYDRFLKGDAGALSQAQLRGMALFQEVGCITCHAGPNFSEASVFSKGAGFRLFPAIETPLVARYPLREDRGAARDAERGLFRVPSLRNVALTAPYFHNGSVSELAEAVRIMATSQAGALLSEDAREGMQVRWQAQAERLEIAQPRVLTARDIEDIVAFLQALTSDHLAKAKTRTMTGTPP